MSFQAKEEADIGTNLNNHNQCPKCGSPNYYEIIYGDPTHEAFLKKKRGEAILFGCCINEKNPPRKLCKKCKLRYN